MKKCTINITMYKYKKYLKKATQNKKNMVKYLSNMKKE